MKRTMKKDIRDAIKFLTDYDYDRIDEHELTEYVDQAVNAVAKIVDKYMADKQ